MKILLYTSKYKNDCINIFKSNQPKYFVDEELIEFTSFLETQCEENYFVVEKNKRIIACGGIFKSNNRKDISGLSWGMVHSEFHQKGIGKEFTIFRLQLISEKFPDAIPTINTSQHTFKFYEKLGFEITKITKDGFGKGLDDYEMKILKNISE